MLMELIYSSRHAGGLSNSEGMDSMLSKIRTYNSTNNITGILLFDGFNFIQLLEGEKKNIDVLFDKIKRDKRHTNIKLENYSETSSRLFNRWSMQYRDMGDDWPRFKEDTAKQDKQMDKIMARLFIIEKYIVNDGSISL